MHTSTSSFALLVALRYHHSKYDVDELEAAYRDLSVVKTLLIGRLPCHLLLSMLDDASRDIRIPRGEHRSHEGQRCRPTSPTHASQHRQSLVILTSMLLSNIDHDLPYTRSIRSIN